LNPFQDEPEASGYAKSIAGAIDALYRASRDRYPPRQQELWG
jgi:hypothetical protein